MKQIDEEVKKGTITNYKKEGDKIMFTSFERSITDVFDKYSGGPNAPKSKKKYGQVVIAPTYFLRTSNNFYPLENTLTSIISNKNFINDFNNRKPIKFRR